MAATLGEGLPCKPTAVSDVYGRSLFCSITAMHSYICSSFEELQFTDYQRGARPSWQETDVTFFGMGLTPEQRGILGITAVLREQFLLKTLRASLTSGDFRDTVFYLYSHKSSRFVQSPLLVFAISSMLVTAALYFETLLNGDFAEANISLRDNSGSDHSLDEKLPLEEYGYECDSDLDDTEEDRVGDSDQYGQGYEDTGEVGSESIGPSPEASMDDFGGPMSTTPSKPCSCLRKIYVKDIAFKTWKAFVFYTYTGRISFAPLRSQPPPNAFFHRGSADHAPTCSPKSMYRLADKCDLKYLKALSQGDIRSKITTRNVVPELFSTFASRYPDIRNNLVGFYAAHRDHPDVTTAMPLWIGKVVRGELLHAGDALNAIIRALTSQAQVRPSN
ncbi:hypothetical protein EDC04DRAFT_2695087 [Pisolithus marmoratus]|nr:hypothetical protein EDC04DRAFT_2695087 [Pisolithus marmoratus]